MKKEYIWVVIVLLFLFNDAKGDENVTSSDSTRTITEFGLSNAPESETFNDTKDIDDDSVSPSIKATSSEFGLDYSSKPKDFRETESVNNTDEANTEKPNNNEPDGFSKLEVFSDKIKPVEPTKTVSTDKTKTLSTLESIVNRCADLTATLENELATLKETINSIKATEDNVQNIADKLNGLEQKYKDKFRTMEIVINNTTKKNDEIETIKETINSMKSKDEDVLKIRERLYTLEEQQKESSGTINAIKNETEDIALIREKVESFNIRRRDVGRMAKKLETMEQKHKKSTGTIESLKRATAELRKGLVDQEITTYLLKRDFIKKKSPIEDKEKSIVEKLNVISKIIVDHDKQLTSVIDGFEKTGLDIEKSVIEEQADLIEEENADNEEILDFHWEEQNRAEKKRDDIFDILTNQGYFKIGEGFYAKNISFMPFGSSIELSGDILNATGTDYNMANFKIFLYDENQQILRQREFTLMGIISSTEALPFYEIISGVDIEKISYYAFAFGEDYKPEELIKKQFDKTFQESVLNSDLKTEPQENEIKVEEIPDEYKEIGGSFYVKDLSITISDYFCTVNGSIRNFSDDYYDTASFIIKLFNKDKELIKQQELYISINENSTIELNETITGIDTEDIIDSYEVRYQEDSTTEGLDQRFQPD